MLKVATPPRPGSRPLFFKPAPLQPPSQQWLVLDEQLPDADLARVILAGINRLDWTGLWDLYAGRGSAAYPPQRLLAVVLYEIREGHTSQAQWFRHARKVDSLRWLLAMAASCWPRIERSSGGGG